jgi:hypothetical protein
MRLKFRLYSIALAAALVTPSGWLLALINRSRRESLKFSPERLVATYATETPTGYALYLLLRPQPTSMHH